MKKTALLYCIALITILSGCGPLLRHSTIIEKPDQKIKSFIIAIEHPNYSASYSESDGILRTNSSQQDAINEYRTNFYKGVNENFVRIMKDNGITTKLVFVPSTQQVTSKSLNVLSSEDLDKWPYVLWIRHQRGKVLTSYRKHAVYVTAYFQIMAMLYDTKSHRMIWKAEDDSKVFYNHMVWISGRIYKDLLIRLNSDGIISLPTAEPIIKTSFLSKIAADQ